VPHASSATRILQQVGGSFGTGAGRDTGLVTAFDRAFWWAIGFTVAGALPALLLRRPPRP
jgi:hypothetical protein